jgi:A/G-specific adenine glycosylase
MTKKLGTHTGVEKSEKKDLEQAGFAHRIVAWQRQHGRNHLPWSGQDAYRVWLSEVMLQQTQVITVLPYYAAFIARYPTVQALAAASIEDVLALWAGLGYYSRARNLYRCAQLVTQTFGGQFPHDLQALESLPGIGPSTAAAIASLAHNERAAILDGNVKRVLARHSGIAGWAGTLSVNKALWASAQARLVDEHTAVAPDHHRRYTQGLMDLGATICTAKSPACHCCPVDTDCVALCRNTVASMPAPRPKKTIPVQTRCALVIHTTHGVWLERRPAQGLWGGLLSLPEAGDESKASTLAQQLGVSNSIQPWHTHQLKHTFTHYQLQWQVWACEVQSQFALLAPWVFVRWDDLHRVGVPKAVLKVLT